MHFGLRLPSFALGEETASLAEMGAYLRHAEDLGFDSAMLIDHLLVAPPAYSTTWLEPITLLSALSGHHALTTGVDGFVARGGVSGATANDHAEPFQTAFDRENPEASRFGDDRTVGFVAMFDGLDGAGSARLFVDDRFNEDVAFEFEANALDRFDREDHRGDATLHVDRTASPVCYVESACDDARAPCICRPCAMLGVG